MPAINRTATVDERNMSNKTWHTASMLPLAMVRWTTQIIVIPKVKETEAEGKAAEQEFKFLQTLAILILQNQNRKLLKTLIGLEQWQLAGWAGWCAWVLDCSMHKGGVEPWSKQLDRICGKLLGLGWLFAALD